MVTDVKATYCGDLFAICTNIKSLHSVPGTNTMLHVNYTSIKKYTTEKEKKGCILLFFLQLSHNIVSFRHAAS